ncbi:MAG: RNA polymerase sigma factor for flagellar operon [Candidatus Kapaibacterium sp.]|nr:MAG: RNA polymerase sigma factor for flagellar operon [Candidatus Kapabacteria bacterium]
MQTSENLRLTWLKYKETQDLKLRNELVLKYISLVKSILNKFKLPESSILTKQDLINIGILGLVDAIEKFDPNQSVKFETYAYPRIKGAIIDELRRIDWLSRGARKRAKEVIESMDKSFVRGGKTNFDELAKNLNLSESEFKSYILAYQASKESFYYTEIIEIEDDGQEIDFLENLASEDEKTALDEMVENEKVQLIYDFLLMLPERDRLIVTLHYYENLKFKEIGQILGLSESRVSQIHSSVIKRLRKKFEAFEE